MARIKSTDETTGRTFWFESKNARRFAEDTRFDGNNHVSINTGSEWYHQTLYRTAGGKWLLLDWSNYEHIGNTSRHLTDDEAYEWLVRNDHDDEEIAGFFGSVEEEHVPDLGGRPPVGPAVQVRIPADDLARLDAAARAVGVTRAEWIRRAITEYLARVEMTL